jgi:YesN/AraC family two-component response regulator
MGPALDLILMDVQMPVMDGHQATREIRQLAPELPIIGLTAHALAEEREKCLASGMVEHLAKPVELEVLLKAILKHLPHGRNSGQETEGRESLQSPLPSQSLTDLINWPELERSYRNRSDFLTRLLSTMLESCTPKPLKLRQLVKLRDFTELAHEAHNLKGLTSPAMPESLRQLAVITEQLAKQELEQANSSALELAAGVEELIKEIASHIPAMDEVSGVETTTIDKEQLEPVIEELKQLLSQDDTLAIERHTEYQHQLRAALGPDAERLGRQIERFDFERALATLQNITMT